MKELPFHIIPFQDSHQPDVDKLMSSIAEEYAENMFSAHYKTTKELSHLPEHQYWAACIDGTVVGTVGFCRLANNNIELKRMFLHKDFRGQGIAKALLDTVMNDAIDSNVSTVFLGTMEQFKTAQAFYEKNGFIKIPITDLPTDFLVNPVDKVFYKKELINQ